MVHPPPSTLPQWHLLHCCLHRCLHPPCSPSLGSMRGQCPAEPPGVEGGGSVGGMANIIRLFQGASGCCWRRCKARVHPRLEAAVYIWATNGCSSSASRFPRAQAKLERGTVRVALERRLTAAPQPQPPPPTQKTIPLNGTFRRTLYSSGGLKWKWSTR